MPRDPLSPPPGSPVRFFAALEDGRRSPSTWRVWAAKNAGDIYFTTRDLGGLVKTSLHESGVGQTSFVREERVFPWDSGELPVSRHLDRWERSARVIPGITHAFRIIMPGSQLVPWKEDDLEPGACRLMMRPDLALAVDLFIVEPTAQPRTLSIPDSVIFARLATVTDREAVLVSRKLQWTAEDEALLDAMKAFKSTRTLTDRRTPRIQLTRPVAWARRMTMFATAPDGLRVVVDAFDPRPLPGYE